MERIRVLLVERYPLLADVTCEVLFTDPGVAVVGEARGADEATRLAAKRRPHVALIDVAAEGKDGLCLTKLLKRAHSGIAVILVGEEASEDYAEAARQAGAAAYLARPMMMTELLPLLRRQAPQSRSFEMVVGPMPAGETLRAPVDQRGARQRPL